MLKYWWFVRDQKWKSGVPDNAKEFLFKKKVFDKEPPWSFISI